MSRERVDSMDMYEEPFAFPCGYSSGLGKALEDAIVQAGYGAQYAVSGMEGGHQRFSQGSNMMTGGSYFSIKRVSDGGVGVHITFTTGRSNAPVAMFYDYDSPKLPADLVEQLRNVVVSFSGRADILCTS